MLAEIGLTATFLAFVAAIYAIVVALYGGRIHSDRLVLSARNAAIATFPLLVIACTMLLIALMTGDYQINYVRSTTDPNTPMFYRFTALWGSQQGSLLFWSMTMSLFGAAALILSWKNNRRLMPYVIAYMMAALTFFLYLNLFVENPFERVWLTPPETMAAETFEQISRPQVIDSLLIPANAESPNYNALSQDARGLNPLLRHFGMIIHPPMLYLGFVGFLVPFAFAMAALASGDLSTNWIKATRRWTLVAWLFLSLGLILGGRWAYDVLGWGGYWGWDPVENAAFLPWLVGTAFLHSVMIQEKRGMLKVWNMVLIIATFSAVMFGTFATRSGLIESVHSFARSEIGLPMFLFWAGITLVSSVMLIWRWRQGLLKDEHHFTGILSRESMFVLNNVIFMALTVAIFWGSFGAPILSELLFDEDITLGVDYFMQVTPPLFLAMYVLMGVAPITAWGATSVKRMGTALTVPLLLTVLTVVAIVATGTTTIVAIVGYAVVSMAGYVAAYEIYRGTRARMRGRKENPLQAFIALFTRNRRRYGGYIVHLGIVIIGIGVIGSTVFQLERQETVQVGETIQVNDEYQLRYDDFAIQQASDGRIIDRAYVTIIRNGDEIRQIEPRIDRFPQNDGSMMPMTIAGAHSTIENDFYVLLGGAGDGEVSYSRATFTIYINPLINLVWWGGLVLILGTIISTWPNETRPVSVRDRSQARPKLAGATA
jgi:cytochrome c-type biogenesis protein CcmF